MSCSQVASLADAERERSGLVHSGREHRSTAGRLYIRESPTVGQCAAEGPYGTSYSRVIWRLHRARNKEPQARFRNLKMRTVMSLHHMGISRGSAVGKRSDMMRMWTKYKTKTSTIAFIFGEVVNRGDCVAERVHCHRRREHTTWWVDVHRKR